MPLPKFQAMADVVSAKDFSLLQTNWAALLDPILGRRQNQSNILSAVPLVVGSNVIDHKLGRRLAGWKIVRQDALASLYDAQNSNQSPELTLVLVSNAVVNVSIEVF